MAPDEIGAPKITMLKKRADFLRVKTGEHWSSRTLVLQAKQSNFDDCRIGLTVTGRTGNSVERSRIKRRLREVVKQVMPISGKPGFDYVIIGKRQILHSKFQALIQDLQVALDRVHSKRAKGSG